MQVRGPAGTGGVPSTHSCLEELYKQECGCGERSIRGQIVIPGSSHRKLKGTVVPGRSWGGVRGRGATKRLTEKSAKEMEFGAPPPPPPVFYCTAAVPVL